jgi:hypothetical protein
MSPATRWACKNPLHSLALDYTTLPLLNLNQVAYYCLPNRIRSKKEIMDAKNQRLS